MAPQLRRNTKFRLDNASNFAVKKRKESTPLSCLQHFDILRACVAGIPSSALHTCLYSVVPNGTFFELKICCEP